MTVLMYNFKTNLWFIEETGVVIYDEWLPWELKPVKFEERYSHA